VYINLFSLLLIIEIDFTPFEVVEQGIGFLTHIGEVSHLYGSTGDVGFSDF
jgi:hypothetical protein